jgi:hypothetical protein
MKRILIILFSLLVLAPRPDLGAQSAAGQLEGVWQTIEIAIAGTDPRTITVPAQAPFFTIFTARHYSRTEVQSEAPRQNIADVAGATADELRAVWGPIVAEAGPYEVSGNTITMHPMASKSPAAMAPGAFIVSTFRIEGDTLWIAQQRNQAGPYPNPVTFRLTRIE